MSRRKEGANHAPPLSPSFVPFGHHRSIPQLVAAASWLGRKERKKPFSRGRLGLGWSFLVFCGPRSTPTGKVLFLHLPFWTGLEATDLGVDSHEKAAVLAFIENRWRQSDIPFPLPRT